MNLLSPFIQKTRGKKLGKATWIRDGDGKRQIEQCQCSQESKSIKVVVVVGVVVCCPLCAIGSLARNWLLAACTAAQTPAGILAGSPVRAARRRLANLQRAALGVSVRACDNVRGLLLVHQSECVCECDESPSLVFSRNHKVSFSGD